MNIYIRELKAHRKSFIIWALALIFLNYAGMAKYSAGTQMPGGFDKMMEDLPPVMQNIFGVGLYDLSKAVEYYAVLFLYIALVGGIHAVMLGCSIISKEERDKTAEFLMVKPVSRTAAVRSKLLAAFTLVAGVNLCTLLSGIAVMEYYSDGSEYLSQFLFLMLGFFAIQIFFLATGAFFAAVTHRVKLSSACATGFLLLTFLISVLIDISGKIDFLKFICPFKYFDAKYFVKGGYEPVYTVVAAIITAFAFAFTFILYKKRDLKV